MLNTDAYPVEPYPGQRRDAIEDNQLDALVKLRALTRLLQATRDDAPPSTETLQNTAFIMESLVNHLLDWHGKTEIGNSMVSMLSPQQ